LRLETDLWSNFIDEACSNCGQWCEVAAAKLNYTNEWCAVANSTMTAEIAVCENVFVANNAQKCRDGQGIA
jgi:hypothetical protein